MKAKKALRAPKAKKPTTKAAGVKAPVAPTMAVVAAEPKQPSKDDPEPVPVHVVGPKPESTLQPIADPVVRPPEPPKAAKPLRGLTPEEEITELEKRIEALKLRLWELQHPIIEFPKMVNGRTFNSREEQDKAGKEFADKN